MPRKVFAEGVGYHHAESKAEGKARWCVTGHAPSVQMNKPRRRERAECVPLQ